MSSNLSCERYKDKHCCGKVTEISVYGIKRTLCEEHLILLKMNLKFLKS